MIKTAKIIDGSAAEDRVGLFDKVEIYMPEDDETEIIQVVTTVRCRSQKGPHQSGVAFGKQVLGKKVGDQLHGPGQRDLQLSGPDPLHNQNQGRWFRPSSSVLSALNRRFYPVCFLLAEMQKSLDISGKNGIIIWPVRMGRHPCSHREWGPIDQKEVQPWQKQAKSTR